MTTEKSTFPTGSTTHEGKPRPGGPFPDLRVHNPHFITYADELFTVDVLGGVDAMQVERMICTLRITYKNYPPLRYTLDLYNDNQSEKLVRTLCDKWGVALIDVSRSVNAFTCQLESYKLERLRYPQGERDKAFEMSEEEQQQAKKYLTDKRLIGNLQRDLRHIGILGEDENALILFLAMASHKSETPFSVLCQAKAGIGKSYLLQKLSGCMPQNTFSFHTQISENALYYFDSRQIDGKTLFVEDLEWTHQMLMPLATLQTQGRLIKTRATKDKDGMLHSTTFEVAGKLCLIACAYSEKNYEQLSLPFLCLHLNHSHTQDIDVMEYQKRCKAGLIDRGEIAAIQRRLQGVIASLKPATIVNPYAPLIDLPDDIPHPRQTLLLLLDFIDAVTFFHQHQRENVVDEQTGEVMIKTHPDDIELAFALLKNSLLRRADELSASARDFYDWLRKYLAEAKTKQFTALDVRKAKRIHPRTLCRYLRELCQFQYIQVTGGNKYREGYQYKITNLDEGGGGQNGNIEAALKATSDRVWKAYGKQQGENAHPEPSPRQEPPLEQEPPFGQGSPLEPAGAPASPPAPKAKKRIRINESEGYTLRLLLALETAQPGREYLPTDFTVITGRSLLSESRYLKMLCEQGKLNREARGRQYYYTLATTGSRTVGQTPLSDSETSDSQKKRVGRHGSVKYKA